MKLLLALALLASIALASPKTQAASPATNAEEEALADGEVDAEDLEVWSPWAAVSGATAGRPVLGARGGSAYLSVVGFSRASLDARRDVGGVVVLGLPFGRVARGGRRMTSPPAPALHAELASAGAPLAVVRTSAAASTGAQPFDLTLTPRLARACVVAAWRAAGLGVDESRLEGIAARARWSALLPEARLRALRSDDSRLSLDTTTASDTSRLRDSAGANVGLEARLTWRFDRLIYAGDEPAFERIRLEHRDARARIGARVLDALFHWQRAALDLRSVPPSEDGTRDEADVALRVMEAEAALDVLTNGWFSAHGPRVPTPHRPSSPPSGDAAPFPAGEL